MKKKTTYILLAGLLAISFSSCTEAPEKAAAKEKNQEKGPAEPVLDGNTQVLVKALDGNWKDQEGGLMWMAFGDRMTFDTPRGRFTVMMQVMGHVGKTLHVVTSSEGHTKAMTLTLNADGTLTVEVDGQKTSFRRA